MLDKAFPVCTPLSDRFELEPTNSTFPTGFGWIHFDIDDCNHVDNFESIYEENIARYENFEIINNSINVAVQSFCRNLG